MPSLRSPRCLPGHTSQLSDTNAYGGRSRLCPKTTYRAGPAPSSLSNLRSPSAVTASTHPRCIPHRAFPATIPPFTSQVSFVPNHPYRRTENVLLLRDTVGKRKTSGLPHGNDSTRFYIPSTTGTLKRCITAFQEEIDVCPAGQYRPAYDPHHDSRPTVHSVSTVRPQLTYRTDYHYLNQRGISPDVKNVKDFSLYRKTLQRKKYFPRNAFPRPQALPSELDHYHTYGFKQVSDEKFRAVIENHYGFEKMVELAGYYATSEQARHSENATLKKIRMTKAARGHARRTRAVHQSESLAAPATSAGVGRGGSSGEARPLLDEQGLSSFFKIKRFLQVSPRTCSHRLTCPLKKPAASRGRTEVS